MSAAPFTRLTDEEWSVLQDARDERIAGYIASGAWPEETEADVEAWEAEDARLYDEYRAARGLEPIRIEWPNTLTFTNVSNAGEVETPVFQNGVRRGDLGLVIAESGAGKSYVLLSLAASLATGEVILPAFAPEDWAQSFQASVMVVSYEDPPAVIRERLDAIDPSARWGEAERTGGLRFVHAPQPIFAMQGKRMAITEFGTKLSSTMDVLKPDLLILDPLSAVAVLDDENGNAALHQVAAMLAELARKHDCAIILSHHASKGRAGVATQHMARGGSALACRARWIMTLTRPTDLDAPDLIKATIVKDSYSRTPEPILLRQGADGAFDQVSYTELATAEYEALARTLADSLGANEAGWSARTITSEAPCKEFRDALKSVHGKTASRDGIKAAYAIAISNGWLVEVTETVGGATKRTPRKSLLTGDKK